MDGVWCAIRGRGLERNAKRKMQRIERDAKRDQTETETDILEGFFSYKTIAVNTAAGPSWSLSWD